MLWRLLRASRALGGRVRSWGAVRVLCGLKFAALMREGLRPARASIFPRGVPTGQLGASLSHQRSEVHPGWLHLADWSF